MTFLRRVLFPFRLARSRLGAGGERLLLVAVGIVAGSAALAAVLSGRLVMQDRSLAQATARLAPADRSLEAAMLLKYGQMFRKLELLEDVPTWTDDYSDVLRVMMIPELQRVRKFMGLRTPVER